MKKEDKLASLINQWQVIDAQARQSGLTPSEIDEINERLINALPTSVRALVRERFRI
jgi:hypothetical protein